MKIGIYPGSFDPITNGHIDIIKRSAKIFDKVIVLLSNNNEKKYTFKLDERIMMIKASIGLEKNVEIDYTDGLVAHYAKKIPGSVLIRGTRTTADYLNEYSLHTFNKSINDEIETIVLFSTLDNIFLSSSRIKELASLSDDIDRYVPSNIAPFIIETVRSRK